MKSLMYLLFFVSVWSCSDSNSLKPEEFQKRIQETPDAVVLDVRTQAEASQGILPGALVLDFKASNFQEHIDLLDKSKPYFVYCASGVRSGKTSDQMEQSGFKEVYVLEGGIRAWEDAGLKLQIP